MVNEDIIGRLNILFRQIFDNDTIEINETTRAEDVEDWDSLNHLQIVVAIEKYYGIRFTAAQVEKWNCVGNIVTGIQQKLTQKTLA